MSHDTDQDLELRGRFTAVRVQDEATTPSFERVVHRSPSGAQRRGWLVPGLALAGAAAATVLWLSARKPAVVPWGEGSAVDVAAWRSPTDALLKGTRLGWLGTLPRMSPDPNWMAAPSAGDTVNRN